MRTDLIPMSDLKFVDVIVTGNSLYKVRNDLIPARPAVLCVADCRELLCHSVELCVWCVAYRLQCGTAGCGAGDGDSEADVRCGEQR